MTVEEVRHGDVLEALHRLERVIRAQDQRLTQIERLISSGKGAVYVLCFIGSTVVGLFVLLNNAKDFLKH